MAGTASRTWPKNSRQTVRVTGGILCSTQRAATMMPSVPSFCTPVHLTAHGHPELVAIAGTAVREFLFTVNADGSIPAHPEQLGQNPLYITPHRVLVDTRFPSPTTWDHVVARVQHGQRIRLLLRQHAREGLLDGRREGPLRLGELPPEARRAGSFFGRAWRDVASLAAMFTALPAAAVGVLDAPAVPAGVTGNGFIRPVASAGRGGSSRGGGSASSMSSRMR